MTLPATVKLPDGAFTIRRTAFYKAGEERKLTVEVNGTAQTYDDYSKIYYADVPSLKSNGITLFYQDEDKQRGKDLLNMVVELYNIRRLREEQTKASREIAFIDDRLASLTSQLSESGSSLRSSRPPTMLPTSPPRRKFCSSKHRKTRLRLWACRHNCRYST